MATFRVWQIIGDRRIALFRYKVASSMVAKSGAVWIDVWLFTHLTDLR